ncbi:MAG TPA: hypothetical protein VM432_06740 [Bdellovibrionales bacterium]|jgi:adenosylhomocysteine nucleosidase|nr:hypothetical protein [Bdellovibrionales bacterium]
MSKYLVAIAMKDEAQGLFEKSGIDVLYTGLGKVNASYRLMKEIARRTERGESPTHVLNFGTAGSSKFETHALIECIHFVQRDMNVTALGLDHGVTPFDVLPKTLSVAPKFTWLRTGICGTGDSFETGVPPVACDIVDMEAYALAKICAHEGIAFSCVKYITDGSDHNAHNDWQANLPKAAAAFFETYRRFVDT